MTNVVIVTRCLYQHKAVVSKVIAIPELTDFTQHPDASDHYSHEELIAQHESSFAVKALETERAQVSAQFVEFEAAEWSYRIMELQLN